jgi:hypothetical protein
MVLDLSDRRFVLFCFRSQRDACAFTDGGAQRRSSARYRDSSQVSADRKCAADCGIPEDFYTFAAIATING